MNTNRNELPFGEVIYSYTRSQVVADGFQVEITKIAQEAGTRGHVWQNQKFQHQITPE